MRSVAEPCEWDDSYPDSLYHYAWIGAETVLHGFPAGRVGAKLGHGREGSGGWVPGLYRACRYLVSDCVRRVLGDDVWGEVAAGSEPLEVVAQVGVCQLNGCVVEGMLCGLYPCGVADGAKPWAQVKVDCGFRKGRVEAA